jgi:two-component system, sensor histidine kinase and response regulator
VSEKEIVLVVDDSKSNRSVLTDLLKDDYKVMVAKDGPQALKACEREQGLPDIILLDIMMPEMDGYEVCRRLKSNDATKNIPVIFCTAMSEVRDEAKGFELGAVDYVTKPISPSILVARVKTHLQLKKSLQSEKELNQLKNKFLGIAAHDLRNPLAAIRGFSELMISMELSDEQKKDFIESIFTTSQQMLDLLNELLDVSVIESGNLDLVTELSSLSELVSDRVKLMEQTAKSKNISLSTTLPDVPASQIDAGRFSQVIDNLLSNAIKFSNQDSTIEIEVKATGESLELSVSDQGPGISEEDQAKLFGEFQKLTARPTGGESSTGLGLFIVRRIIDAHHGKISVKSTLGDGATFTVTLPIKN